MIGTALFATDLAKSYLVLHVHLYIILLVLVLIVREEDMILLGCVLHVL